ncbi:Small ubiquitin-related modifier [Thalictrum thalictroides]|uniref:Small ubiquitin-related modifier n=1 Tax=Thalictrum thalictroides TaxID=46969 RepID=A0A7J6VJ11_THATH|nr:Small ubiquitin-related modifier [Thalictrum thalictroides]
MSEADGDRINLKIKDQNGKEIFFRIRRTTELRRVINAYCDRQAMDSKVVRFFYDNQRIRGSETPDELDMEDDAEIDAMMEQTGG